MGLWLCVVAFVVASGTGQGGRSGQLGSRVSVRLQPCSSVAVCRANWSEFQSSSVQLSHFVDLQKSFPDSHRTVDDAIAIVCLSQAAPAPRK